MTKIQLPGSWADISLGQYLRYITVLLPVRPVLPEACTQVEWQATVFPWLVRVVANFAGIDETTLLTMKMPGNAAARLEKAYAHLRDLLAWPEEAQFPPAPRIEHEGQVYVLPPPLMQGATVAEWVESAELLRTSEDAGIEHAAKLLCILLKKPGEAFSEALFSRERQWLTMGMDKVWRVWFFFARQTEIFGHALRYCLTEPAKASKLQQVLNALTSSATISL
jgi:hypothetical protein